MSRGDTSDAAALLIARRRPFRASSVLKHVWLALVAGLFAFPFYWMLTTAFKDFFEASQFPPTLVPRELHPENFVTAWNEAPWTRYFLNTILVATSVTLGTLITATLAAYAFARMEFKGKSLLFTLVLATLMIPNEATIIPNFVIMGRRYLNLYDTYWAQILPFVASGFSIFLLRQFFLSFPRELFDAARIDGAGHLRFLSSILLPNSTPVLVTVALFNFLASWNAFLWPLLVTSKDELRPVQLGVQVFSSEFGSQYHLTMAAATFVILPVIVLFLVAQRQLIQGYARAGIRG